MEILTELISLGIPADMAKRQLDLLKNGTRYAKLASSATLSDGIERLSAQDIEHCSRQYDDREETVRVTKFVPASGAATRMFKHLIALHEEDADSPEARYFFKHLADFPFQDVLSSAQGEHEVLEQLLTSAGVSFKGAPKGMIPFHRYSKDEVRTAFEEHLVEGEAYARSGNKVHIHFTLSLDHLLTVSAHLKKLAHRYGEVIGCNYALDFSTQAPHTDTVAIDAQGQVMRTLEGNILRRPGGHGALIHNLAQIDSDIVFIKNVDNVVTDAHRAETVRYKKALAGLLIEVRKEARTIITSLKAQDTNESAEQAMLFLKSMGTDLMERPSRDELIRLMNRPYRICGMVANEGEPGGGPFWVNTDMGRSLQIVESAQIDKQNAAHRTMLEQGTHFNPVDLVCCLNDLYGDKIDLTAAVDHDAAFVTDKVVNGQPARVIEWPGLWNGAMANWNTRFVEVPVSTFSPVKTVNDLLKPLHREPGN